MIIKTIIKKSVKESVKEKFDGIKELTNEINHNDLIYYFKGDTASKIFDSFNNGIELFRKMLSAEIKLEEAKKLCLNQIYVKYQEEGTNQKSKKVH